MFVPRVILLPAYEDMLASGLQQQRDTSHQVSMIRTQFLGFSHPQTLPRDNVLENFGGLLKILGFNGKRVP